MLPFQIPVMLRASEVCWLHDKDNREIIELKECPQVSHTSCCAAVERELQSSWDCCAEGQLK